MVFEADDVKKHGDRETADSPCLCFLDMAKQTLESRNKWQKVREHLE